MFRCLTGEGLWDFEDAEEFSDDEQDRTFHDGVGSRMFLFGQQASVFRVFQPVDSSCVCVCVFRFDRLRGYLPWQVQFLDL